MIIKLIDAGAADSQSEVFSINASGILSLGLNRDVTG